MIKVIILLIAIAITFGILSYENDKVVIDTTKLQSVIQEGLEVINENMGVIKESAETIKEKVEVR